MCLCYTPLTGLSPLHNLVHHLMEEENHMLFLLIGYHLKEMHKNIKYVLVYIWNIWKVDIVKKNTKLL